MRVYFVCDACQESESSESDELPYRTLRMLRPETGWLWLSAAGGELVSCQMRACRRSIVSRYLESWAVEGYMSSAGMRS